MIASGGCEQQILHHFASDEIAMNTRLLFALCCAAPVARATGQALPAGADRPWVELTVGAGREIQNCPGCARDNRVGGPTATLAGGLTITPQFGIALLARAFTEFTLEQTDNGQGSTYLMAVGQFSPPRASWFTLDAGGGYGHHTGNNVGDGAAVSTGFALRATGGSRFGVTLDLSVIQSVTGQTRSATLGGQSTSYHPTLVSIDLGLSLAGRHGA
jgi:hypothetical protein